MRPTSSFESLRLLIQRRRSVSPVSAAAAELIQLIDQGATGRQLADAVSKHPEVAIRVIQVASSPIFAARQISSIQYAIDLLGSRQVLNVVLALGVAGAAKDALTGTAIDAERFGTRSLLLAHLMRLLATKCGKMAPDEAFMAGLFLDSGYMVLGKHAGNDLQTIVAMAATGRSGGLIEAERSHLGFDHASLGTVLAREVKLAPTVVAAIQFHHGPFEAPLDDMPYADLAHLASAMADEAGHLLVPGAAAEDWDPGSAERLELPIEPLMEAAQSLGEKAAATAHDIS